MKKFIIICIYFLVQVAFGQNECLYFPEPNQDKIREIQYKYDTGQVLKKEKYFYTKEWKLERIETSTPFDFLDMIQKYHYNKEGKINHISYLNKFNYIYKRDEYTHFTDKYIVKRIKLDKLEDIYIFDTLDRRIEHKAFFRNKPGKSYKYTYKGNNKKYSEYLKYNMNNELEEKQTFEYNKNNDEVKIIIEKPNELTITEITTYNNQDKTLGSLRTDSNGRIIRRSTFEYSKNSKTRISRAEDDVLSDKNVWLYNENKQLTSEITYRTGMLDDILNVSNKMDYFYDSTGDLLSTSNYLRLTGKLLLQKKEFYNKKKQFIKEEEYYLGELISVSEMKNGLVVLEKKYHDGKITRITNFGYDKKGNLILIDEKYIDRNRAQKTQILYDEIGRRTYKNL